MKYRLSILSLFGLALALTLAVPASGDADDNPGVLPPNSRPYGKTYGEWGAEWWKWAASIPAAQNPGLDPTGRFGHIGQSGPVWFLIGLYGSGSVERTVNVPVGKALLIPFYNWVWWAPDDLATAEFVAEHLGFTDEEIAAMSDEDLIRLAANYTAGTPPFDPPTLTCTVDGVPLRNLLQYNSESPAFRFVDTDLWDDFGIPISQPNLSVTAGYYVMLAPLPPGRHTIRYTTSHRHSLPAFDLDMEVTYHVNVVRP